MNKPSELPMETLKAAPSVTVGTLFLFGYPLSDWLLLITIIYYSMLTLFLVRDKWWRQRDRKGKKQ
jgi:hypothetical protein